MFGGLDIKGAGNADAGKSRDTGAAAPPATSSSFSFLNLGTTTSSSSSGSVAMTEHTTAVTSAFSFLTMGPESSAAPPPAVPTMSAFSFLQPTPAQSNENDQQHGVSSQAALVASLAADSASAASLSPFNFLTSPVMGGAPSEDARTSNASSMSAFSFLSSPSPIVPVEVNPTYTSTSLGSSGSLPTVAATSSTTNEISGDLAASSTTSAHTSSSHWDDHLATANSSMPAGSGVVFGGAVTLEVASTSKKPIKKRNRVQRVGVGAGSSLPPSPPKAATVTSATNSSQPPAAQASDRDETESDRRKHREEAEEAAWRAEQFLREKIMENTSKSVAVLDQQQQQQQQPPSYGAAVELTRTKSASSYRSDQNEGELDEDDDVVAAAKAAAEEARHLSSSSLSSSTSSRQRSLGDRLGGLFQRKPWGQNSMGAPSLVPSINSATPSWIAGGRSTPDVPTGEMTAVERIQREQEEIKRAMAERQLAMQQLRQQQPQPQTLQQSYHQQHHQYPPRPSTDEVEPPAETTTVTREVIAAPPAHPHPEPPVVQQQPPPTPPPKAPADLFDEIMVDFNANVKKAMDRVGQLRQQRSMLLEERFVTLAKERLASQQMAQAEAQQVAAAEAEDFDLADQMGTVLEAHARERSELDSILQSIGRALEQLEIQRVQVVGAVAECFTDVRSRLKKFEKEQLTKESQDDTDAMRKFSAVAKQLSAENERLQQDLKHLERDETLVSEERKELEVSISEHSGEHEAHRTEAMEKLRSVEEEIEELRRCLAAKEAVAEELRNEVRSQDEAIGKIRVKFSRQLLRVQTKEATLKENRQEWENEKATFERQKDSHETEVQAHSQALLQHEELMNRLKNEISLAATFERIVSKEVGFDELLKDNEETDGDLAQMHSEVVKCEAAVSKATDVLKASIATLTALEEEHKQLIARIPDLESEKKAAAARRDFKAASKASKEIKDATIRLKECLQELTCEAAERKTAAEEELKKLEAELEETRKTTQEKEKISGDAAMLVLAQKIKDLIATKKRICGNASGASVQGIGAYVLSGQIESLKMEGQALGSKYGGWDALLAEIESAENAEAEEVDAVSAKEAAKDYGELEAESSGSDNGIEPDIADAQNDLEAEPEAEKYSRDERIAKFKELTAQLKSAEESLEAAVAREDYDEAAELDEVFQGIQKALEALDLTDEDMEIAVGGDEAGASNKLEHEQEEAGETKEEPEDESSSESKNYDKGDDTKEEKEAPVSEPNGDESASQQPTADPNGNEDAQANGDSVVFSDGVGQNGKSHDQNAAVVDKNPSPENGVGADSTNGYAVIQESDLGAQAEC